MKNSSGKQLYAFYVFVMTALFQGSSPFFSVTPKLKVDFGGWDFNSKFLRLRLRVRPQKQFFISFFILELSDWSFLGFFIFVCEKVITLITNVINRLVWIFAMNWYFTGLGCKISQKFNFFSLCFFFFKQLTEFMLKSQSKSG